jgi:hypothetical protein
MNPGNVSDYVRRYDRSSPHAQRYGLWDYPRLVSETLYADYGATASIESALNAASCLSSPERRLRRHLIGHRANRYGHRHGSLAKA